MDNIFQVDVEEVVKVPGSLPHSEAQLRELFDKQHGSLPVKPLYGVLKRAFEADQEMPADERASKLDDTIEELKEYRKSGAYDAFWATYKQYVGFVYPTDAATPEQMPIPTPAPVEEQILIEEEIAPEQAEQYFSTYKDTCLDAVRGRGLRILTSRSVFEDQGISVHTQIRIEYPEGMQLSERLAFLTDHALQQVIASGRLLHARREGGDMLYFCAPKENIHFDRFTNTSRLQIVFLDASFQDLTAGCPMYAQEIQLKHKELPTDDKHCLCIDFGTSNTSAGSYHIKDRSDPNRPAELVEFVNTYDHSLSKICPTMVYVKDCSSEENLSLLFGYEAKKKLIEKDYVTDATVIFELKKWVSESKYAEVELHDENYNDLIVRKHDIVKRYLDYIIERSQEFFGVKFTSLHLQPLSS